MNHSGGSVVAPSGGATGQVTLATLSHEKVQHEARGGEIEKVA